MAIWDNIADHPAIAILISAAVAAGITAPLTVWLQDRKEQRQWFRRTLFEQYSNALQAVIDLIDSLNTHEYYNHKYDNQNKEFMNTRKNLDRYLKNIEETNTGHPEKEQIIKDRNKIIELSEELRRVYSDKVNGLVKNIETSYSNLKYNLVLLSVLCKNKEIEEAIEKLEIAHREGWFEKICNDKLLFDLKDTVIELIKLDSRLRE